MRLATQANSQHQPWPITRYPKSRPRTTRFSDPSQTEAPRRRRRRRVVRAGHPSGDGDRLRGRLRGAAPLPLTAPIHVRGRCTSLRLNCDWVAEARSMRGVGILMEEFEGEDDEDPKTRSRRGVRGAARAARRGT